jgi:hypothetical protein
MATAQRRLPKSVIAAKNIKNERARHRRLGELGRYGNRVKAYRKAMARGGKRAALEALEDFQRQLRFKEFEAMAKEAHEDICPVDD